MADEQGIRVGSPTESAEGARGTAPGNPARRVPDQGDPWWLCLPRQVAFGGGTGLELRPSGVLVASPAAPLAQALERLAEGLHRTCGIRPEVRARAGDGEAALLQVTLHEGDTSIPDQGYRLTVSDAGAELIASSRSGVLYGLETFLELAERYGTRIPAVRVEDAPHIPVRGVMLDISRTKVPTQETLRRLVDRLARLRVNHLELYMEHTFAYRSHPEAWAGASPMTGEDILNLDAYCREREIDLVPNQNTLGHLTRWLRLDRYRPLAEVTEGSEFPWGFVRGPFSLSPANPDSLRLVRSLLDELLPHFTSRFAHIGFDEAYDVGQGQSRALCDEKGRGRVLVDFLKDVAEVARAQGRQPLFWADMLTRHDAEVIRDLPEDLIACEWGYDADYDFDATLEPLAKRGLPFYVCPGTASWLSFTGRGNTAEHNLRRAAEAADRYGAAGFLITDWGDRGHFQPLPVSYPGFAYGAALAWNPAVRLDDACERALGVHLLGDRTGEAGRILWEYNRLNYELCGDDGGNAAPLARPLTFADGATGLDAKALAEMPERARDRGEALADALDRCPMEDPEAPLLREEMRHAARALPIGARMAWLSQGEGTGELPTAERESLARDLAAWQAEFRELWLKRFRPGGLEESLAFLSGAWAKVSDGKAVARVN